MTAAVVDKSQPIKIFRANAYYIPIDSIDKRTQKRLINKFTYRFYEERACTKCDNLPDRHNDTCDACPSFKSTVQTAKEEVIKERRYLSVPRGGKDRMLDILEDLGYEHISIKRKAPEPTPFRRSIKFTGELYDYQEDPIKTCIRDRLGILKSAPRTGKTVMGAAIVCRVGMKTLILAHQHEWLVQFRETFIGSDTQKAFTNARPNQVAICKTLEDFQTTDVCLATFATFMSDKGKALLRKIRSFFTTIIVDECQGVPAKETSRVMAVLNFHILIGLSGTPARKKSEEWILADDLIGPILCETKVDRLRPRVEILPTTKKEFKATNSQAGFTYLMARLEADTPRRQVIIRDIIKRAKAGHLVMVPLTRVNSILRWTREINQEAERAGFALPFFGGLRKDQRAKVVQAARNYECRVVVGNISLLSTGLNIPRASCLYEVGVNSNIPKAGQRYSRILTPHEGKPAPQIVFTLDNCDLMRKCRMNEFWNCLIKDFDPIIDPQVKSELLSYFSSTKKNQRQVSFDDIREGL